MEYAMTPVTPEQSTVVTTQVTYAGFWRRFFASLLDCALVFIVYALITSIFTFIDNALSTNIATGLFLVVIGWLYFALFEGSYLEATLGKIVFGIRVRMLDGRPINFNTATARFFGKFLSLLTLCAGFIMCAFTKKRQALHDILSSTVVIRNPMEGAVTLFADSTEKRTGSIDDVIASFGNTMTPVTTATNQQPALAPAGFWKRAAAWIIDVLAIELVLTPLRLLIGLTWLAPHFNGRDYFDFHSREARIRIIYSWISILVNWLYSSIMESSSKQGTLGKMALAIKVTDLNGERIGFGRATGRHFAKIISTVTLFIGFMMAGWTHRKQALHDIIAGTLVLGQRPAVPAHVAQNAFQAQ